MKNNVVEVKQEHIDNGVKGCPCYCAVSLAVYDALEDKYKFSPIRLGDADSMREAVEVGESWIETAVQGSGAEISIYTKHFNNTKEEIEIVEDYIEIKEDAREDFKTNASILEEWIEDFDTYEVEPTSFVIESINRMNK